MNKENRLIFMSAPGHSPGSSLNASSEGDSSERAAPSIEEPETIEEIREQPYLLQNIPGILQDMRMTLPGHEEEDELIEYLDREPDSNNLLFSPAGRLKMVEIFGQRGMEEDRPELYHYLRNAFSDLNPIDFEGQIDPIADELYRDYIQRIADVHNLMEDRRESLGQLMNENVLTPIAEFAVEWRDNLREMDPAQRHLAQGALFAGLLYTFLSNDETAQKLRPLITSGALLTVGALAGNAVIEMFTGQSGLEWLDRWNTRDNHDIAEYLGLDYSNERDEKIADAFFDSLYDESIGVIKFYELYSAWQESDSAMPENFTNRSDYFNTDEGPSLLYAVIRVIDDKYGEGSELYETNARVREVWDLIRRPDSYMSWQQAIMELLAADPDRPTLSPTWTESAIHEAASGLNTIAEIGAVETAIEWSLSAFQTVYDTAMFNFAYSRQFETAMENLFGGEDLNEQSSRLINIGINDIDDLEDHPNPYTHFALAAYREDNEGGIFRDAMGTAYTMSAVEIPRRNDTNAIDAQSRAMGLDMNLDREDRWRLIRHRTVLEAYQEAISFFSIEFGSDTEIADNMDILFGAENGRDGIYYMGFPYRPPDALSRGFENLDEPMRNIDQNNLDYDEFGSTLRLQLKVYYQAEGDEAEALLNYVNSIPRSRLDGKTRLEYLLDFQENGDEILENTTDITFIRDHRNFYTNLLDLVARKGRSEIARDSTRRVFQEAMSTLALQYGAARIDADIRRRLGVESDDPSFLQQDFQNRMNEYYEEFSEIYPPNLDIFAGSAERAIPRDERAPETVEGVGEAPFNPELHNAVFTIEAFDRTAADTAYNSTGFVIWSNGATAVICTTAHGIPEDSSIIQLRGNPGIMTNPVTANLLAKDDRNDIALLRVQANALPSDMPVLGLADEDPAYGDSAWVLGSEHSRGALEQSGTFQGTPVWAEEEVSQFVKARAESFPESWMAISQEGEQGRSGSPVLTRDGKVAGIVRGQFEDYTGGIIVSVSHIRDLLENATNSL